MTDKKRGDNLILIGLPTSGKSTVGVILAKALGYEFTDIDLLIQKKEGKKLSMCTNIPGNFLRIGRLPDIFPGFSRDQS